MQNHYPVSLISSTKHFLLLFIEKKYLPNMESHGAVKVCFKVFPLVIVDWDPNICPDKKIEKLNLLKA